MQMGYGKPRETIDLHVNVEEDLSTLSIEELQQRAQALVDQLADAQALADAIPAETVYPRPNVDLILLAPTSDSAEKEPEA
jgi:hypothetical protein